MLETPPQKQEGLPPRLVDRFMLPIFAAGAGALLAAPSAMPVIAPMALLVTLLVAVGAGAVFEHSRAAHLAAAFLLGIAAEHLLLFPGLPVGHDLTPHSWGIWAFFQAMREGDLTPQWLHHISLGLPLPLYYCPATYYAATPFFLAGLSTPLILKGCFLLDTFVGVGGMYLLGRRWTGSSRAGLVAAAAYAFAPFRLITIQSRFALAESQALALLPWLFGLFFDPGPWSRRRVAAAAGVAGLMVLTHPLSVLTTGVAALVWQGFEILCNEGDRFRRFGIRAVAAVLGLAIASFYVVPMVARLDLISLGNAVPEWDTKSLAPAVRGFAEQGLTLDEPFLRRPPFSHYLGWGLFFCAALTGALGVRKLLRGSAPVRAILELPLAVVTLASLLLALQPVADVTSRLPLFPTLQFPWRFLGPATFASALTVAFVARTLVVSRRPAYAAVLLVLLAADGLPYTGATEWVPPYEGFSHFHLEDPGCGRRWGCWESEPVEGPLPWRVLGAFLPPTDFKESVANVDPGFKEYLNPLALRSLLDATSNEKRSELGVGLVDLVDRSGVSVLPPAPYAQLYPSGSNDREALKADRGSGTIEVLLPGQAGTLVVLEQYRPEWIAEIDGQEEEVQWTDEGFLRLPVGTGSKLARLRFHFSGWDVWVGRATTCLALGICLGLALKPRSKVETC